MQKDGGDSYHKSWPLHLEVDWLFRAAIGLVACPPKQLAHEVLSFSVKRLLRRCNSSHPLCIDSATRGNA